MTKPSATRVHVRIKACLYISALRKRNWASDTYCLLVSSGLDSVIVHVRGAAAGVSTEIDETNICGQAASKEDGDPNCMFSYTAARI